ncbi:MAG: DUF2878 domain-containing protein [Halomonas sp.]|uniref:DUF2878 domain-containing protein n=1 Tax=Halomonas sp. TaxID=1486246 RepID=UPI002ACD7D22|nr:DUF2878 domain-containing protein [Halomonas sp.]MDZ7854143.1 DUF2878 domain-containing protein [Halomonas sp.]
MANRTDSPVKMLTNLAAFQIGWFACVLGGSGIGLLTTTVIIALHLTWLARSGEWRWLVGFAALGLAVDGGMALAGGFGFADETRVLGVMPMWLWLLWPLFATLVHHSLAWLWQYPWLAVLGGATSGPLSYYGGARLAGVDLAPWLLPAEALVWALICIALSWRLGNSLALNNQAR